MSIKFSVGVSDVHADDLLLEECRQSPQSVGADEDLETRQLGWLVGRPATQSIAPEPADLAIEDNLPNWAW